MHSVFLSSDVLEIDDLEVGYDAPLTLIISVATNLLAVNQVPIFIAQYRTPL